MASLLVRLLLHHTQGNLSRGSYDDDYEAALQTKRTAVAAAKQQAQVGEWIV
jgi:hypothetical protein